MRNYSNEITGPTADQTSLSAKLREKIRPDQMEAVLAGINRETDSLISAAHGTRGDITAILGRLKQSVLTSRTTLVHQVLKIAAEQGIKDPETIALIRKLTIQCAAARVDLEINSADSSPADCLTCIDQLEA